MMPLHHLLGPRRQILIHMRRSPKEKLRCLHWHRTKQSKHQHLRWKWWLWYRSDFRKLHRRGNCMKRGFLSKKILVNWYLKKLRSERVSSSLKFQNCPKMGQKWLKRPLTVAVFIFNQKLNHQFWDVLRNLIFGCWICHSTNGKKFGVISCFWKRHFDTTFWESLPQVEFVSLKLGHSGVSWGQRKVIWAHGDGTYRWVFHPYSRQEEQKQLQQRCESLQRNAMRIQIGRVTWNGRGQCCPCISSWFRPFPRRSMLRRWPSRTILLELGTRILILIHIERIQKGQLIHLHLRHTIWNTEGSRYQWWQYQGFCCHKHRGLP